MLEVIIFIVITFSVVAGFVIYRNNIFDEETKNFLLMPWIVSSFLAFLDGINIIFSEQGSWIEIFGGTLMFFGPLWISISIVTQGLEIHGKTKKGVFLWYKIISEYKESPAQGIVVMIGLMTLTSLITVDLLSSFGGKYWVEFIFAVITVILDIVVVIALISEILKYSSSFEKISWSLWIFGAFATFIWNLFEDSKWYSIGSLLLLESALVSLTVLIFIVLKQRQ
jgi:hypothetical protein